MRSAKNSDYLDVAVYWGGAELGSFHKRLSKVRGVTAGKGWLSDIKSIIWPRWDNLEIIQKTKSGLILNPNIPWNGVISSGSGTYVLQALKPTRKIFEIVPGTSASLRLDDMSIAIRVGAAHKKVRTKLQPARGYLASPFSFIADRPVEWTALLISFVAAGVIALSARSTLKSRDNDLYNGLAELPDINLLPFISQKHLAEAPNVIQFSLDRFDFVHNVWRYYSEFAETVGFGRSNSEKPLLFSSIGSEYKGLFDSQSKTINLAESKQAMEIRSPDEKKGFIAIPTVSGESVDGKVMRVLDKIAVFSAAAQEMASKRIAVAEAFEKDLGLVKEEKTDKAGNEAFEKIAQGYLGIESDDKMQESLAKSSAARAALSQMDLFGEERLQFGPLDCCEPPAGAPLNQTGFTWIARAADDYKTPSPVAALKASTWGAPVSEQSGIKEPLSGKLEPALVERTISAGRYQLRLCYELALRRNQAIKGSMEWRWYIDTQGRISNLDLLQTSIKDDELVRCVYDKIANWKFPKPKGGSVEVRYPFEFSRDKG